MKTFLIALTLMSLVFTFVIGNSIIITHKTDALLTLAESLPASAAEFEEKRTDIEQDVYAFSALWDRSFPALTYTSAYENINRADESVILLFAAYKNNCPEDFVAARDDFCDAMRRLRTLESISFSSIF